ncbi:MAG: dipeptidase [Rhodothermaceae bacterium]|nr:dipeptidase [Rhodothermaceae bacterium]MYF63919.1 dipeptidase [Rhodothermaceae bacterium]MYI84896.1 dipeptidase [Rhodothermaceae bacterium]
MNDALDYARANQERFVGELIDLLRIPSISTDPAYSQSVADAAGWLTEALRDIGVKDAVSNETNGHPIVTGEVYVDAALPTVLVYGHYDVQPPDPLDLWNSPPFEPLIKDGLLYARGACDDKGQLLMHLKALECWMRTTGKPPVNLKFILEGEEESGSASLSGFIREYKDALAADIVVISDSSLFAPGIPSITYGLRGMAYVEFTLTGPDRDLHSGTYGGAVHNPINALGALIGEMHDENNRIAIDGFYDDVRSLSERERSAMAALPFDAEAWAQEVGVEAPRVEAGYSVLEASTVRPTLDCNGIWGGYTGDGAKTVLPSKASAKISMRLVPDQDPEEIAGLIEAWLRERVPDSMQLQFRSLHGAQPVLVDTGSAAMTAASKALSDVYGRDPYFTRIGGSIPVVADFKHLLGLDSVLMGFGLDSDAIHSPNEHFGLDRFEQGIEAIVRFHTHYASCAGSA